MIDSLSFNLDYVKLNSRINRLTGQVNCLLDTVNELAEEVAYYSDIVDGYGHIIRELRQDIATLRTKRRFYINVLNEILGASAKILTPFREASSSYINHVIEYVKPAYLNIWTLTGIVLRKVSKAT